MDWGSVAGVTLALIGILLGQAIEGGNLNSLMQPAAFTIVTLGTVGAVLLQTKLSNVLAGLRMAKLAFRPPLDDRAQLAKRISLWSQIARKDGILMLEPYLNKEADPFIKKGLRLMVDGTPAEKIREIISVDMHFYEVQQRNAAKIWDAAGGYAPTIGILGAVLGLIHVMENLAEPTILGGGIAVAFVATIYGVALANLVFLPIAGKLKSLIQQELTRREMLLNAWVAISNGDHPKIIEERTQAYLLK
jgi:chemotaxis protein MotA